MSKLEDTHKSSFLAQAKKVLIGLFIATIAGIALYALGWWQGSSSVDSGEQKVKTVQKELETQTAQINQLKNRAYLMQARAALFRTAVDLDQRNFGVANTHLQEAATALSQVKDDSNQIDTANLGKLQQKIAQTNINVAVNLEKQRQQVLGFVDELNPLIPDELQIQK